MLIILWGTEMLFTHKIGFGSNQYNKENFDTDWAIENLSDKSEDLGIRTLNSNNIKVENWPKKYDKSLSERVTLLREWVYVREEKLDPDKSLSKLDYEKKYRELKKKTRIDEYDKAKFAHRAIYGTDPVRKRFVHFWFNHFTIGPRQSPIMFEHFINDVIDEGLDTNFSELAYKVTTHPCMLGYLDNIFNTGENSEKAKNNRSKGNKEQVGLNDNLARELMELHTTSPSSKYTEKDIREAAKILAGWGLIISNKDSKRYYKDAGITDYQQAYVKYHAEPGNKVVLGKTYKAGKEALSQFVNNLSTMEETIDHISYKLCLHFISDNPKIEDVNYVKSEWIKSKGNLKKIHEAVIHRTFMSEEKKFQWPITWALTVLRISGAHLISGWEDIHSEGRFENKINQFEKISKEFGQSFWEKRQPNGFSLHSSDWISPEHMERRIRFANLVFKYGNPSISIDQLEENLNLSDDTRQMLKLAINENQKFTLLMCSKEMIGT